MEKTSGREESVAGMVPVSLLYVSRMDVRVLICESEFGISPEMLVPLMMRTSSLVSLEMEGGIVPTRLGMLSIERKFMKGRLVNMEGGI